MVVAGSGDTGPGNMDKSSSTSAVAMVLDRFALRMTCSGAKEAMGGRDFSVSRLLIWVPHYQDMFLPGRSLAIPFPWGLQGHDMQR